MRNVEVEVDSFFSGDLDRPLVADDRLERAEGPGHGGGAELQFAPPWALLNKI